LAFEDNWPNVGDYDLNDLVIREQLRTIYDADGDITGFKITGFIDARGAAYHNGFAVRLMDVPPSQISEANLTIDGQTFSKTPEEFQTDAVLVLWQDSHTFTQTGESGKCEHFNTVVECTQFDAVPFELDVELTSPLATLNHSSLDFFIFRTNDRSLEIHFADYAPTDLFDVTRFGRLDDSSDPSSSRYFKNENNLPWALKIDAQWRHPQEYIDVIWAYPAYEDWVESSGAQEQQWYIFNGRTHHIY